MIPFSASWLAILFLGIPHKWLKIGIMEVGWIVRGTNYELDEQKAMGERTCFLNGPVSRTRG